MILPGSRLRSAYYDRTRDDRRRREDERTRARLPQQPPQPLERAHALDGHEASGVPEWVRESLQEAMTAIDWHEEPAAAEKEHGG